MENWELLSGIGGPVLGLILAFVFKKLSANKLEMAIKIVGIVQKELLDAQVEGNKSLVHNDDVVKGMDKINIELGVGK
jgi:hypothetical protein